LKRAQIFGKTLFVDLMMSTLVVVTCLLIVSNAIEKAKRKQLEDANIRTEGIYAIAADWSDASADDIDLYVRDPAGNTAFFNSRDVGLMHLEHDDQGTLSDQAQTVSGKVVVTKNEERVVLRGIIAGEYVVNVHMYNKRDPKPTKVRIRLVRLKGLDSEVIVKERTLPSRGVEQTAFRFTLGADEAVSGINELQRSILGADSPMGPMPGDH
jgi:hypothetical protein